MRSPLRTRAGCWIFSAAAFLLFTVRSLAIIDVALQMQLGNPSGATADTANHTHYLIQHDQYAIDFNDTTHEPNWVSWDLTTGDVGGSGRSDFIADPGLPVGFFVVQPSGPQGYTGSGYDRGHMCPSADRTVTTADNQVLFYMSNMIPQAPDNNQGVWASFESYCRTQASAGNEVLITCGPSGFGGSTISSGVAIPGYTWKIAVIVPLGAGTALSRIDGSTRVIAIKIPNVAGVRNDPWQNYITTAHQIELDTGYTFFTALPVGVAATLRSKTDGSTATNLPIITSQPSNQSAGLGGTVTFSVTASSATTLTYQWNKDAEPIVGETDSSLTVSDIQLSDAGAYAVTVTNDNGSVTSSSAQLIITGLPPVIDTSPANQSVSAGTTVTFSVSASGSPTLTYQWRKDGSPLGNGGNIGGATGTILTISNPQAADAGSYDVVVTNSVNFATSAAATLTVSPAGPTITVQPAASPTVSVNSTATLTVVAKGTAPLTYVWRKGGSPLSDGGNISGAATASLAIANAQAGDAGTYDVQVDNSVGPLVTSNASTLTVNTSSTILWNFGTATTPPLTAAPTSGLPSDVTGGTVASNNSFGATTLLSTTSASNVYAGASAGGNAGVAVNVGSLNTGTSAYFEVSLTPAAGKQVNVTALKFGTRGTTTGPQQYSLYSSANGFVSAIASGAVPNTSTWTAIIPTISTQTSAIATPITLRIYGYGGSGSPSSGTINWRIDDLNVTVNTVIASSQSPAVLSTTPAANATEIPLNSGITVSFNQAVSFTGSWFVLNSAAHGPLAATVTGGPFAWTLTPPVNFDPGDVISLTVLAAQVTDQATGLLHPDADYAMSFNTSLPVTPSVTVQPQPAASTAGSRASFSVTAAGTLPLSYQWRHDGVAITGNATATSPTFTIDAVQVGDAGGYDVVVTNAVGTITSNVAALAITAAPVTAIYWDFSVATPLSGLPADITGGTVTQNNNSGATTFLAAGAGAGYTGASGGNAGNFVARVGALNTTPTTGSAFLQTTLTPAAGKQIVLTALSFGSLSSSPGPQTYKVFSSVDGYATAIAAGPMRNDNTWVLYAPIVTPVTGAVDTPVTIRLYGYNGAGSPSGVDWKIDDLKIAATAVVPLTALETWRQGFFGTSANTGNAADAADPDHDGLSNLVEYGLGTNPTTSDTTGIPVVSTDASNWLYTYNRPAARSDLTYSVEVSTDLVTWTTAGVTLTRIATGTTETWQATYPLSTPNVFFRLRVDN